MLTWPTAEQNKASWEGQTGNTERKRGGVRETDASQWPEKQRWAEAAGYPVATQNPGSVTCIPYPSHA